MKFKASGIEFDVLKETTDEVEIQLRNNRRERFTVKPGDLEAASDFKRKGQEPVGELVYGLISFI